jgi:hypothetical protein
VRVGVREGVMLVVTGVWAVVVGAAVAKFLFGTGELPNPALLGIPAGTYVAIYSPILPGNRTKKDQSDA